MPEGPSIVIVKENLAPFIGKRIIGIEGNSKMNIKRLENETLDDVKTWGKHLLLCFNGFTFRIHFLLFGTYLINDIKKAPLRLGIIFNEGIVNFYSCSIKILDGDLNQYYDWSIDVLNKNWDEKSAIKKLKNIPNMMICDALLEQEIFAGVGNIIKNEILYRVGIHPESMVGKIPIKHLKNIVKQGKIYSIDFLNWKKEFTLKQHWLVHTKKVCLRCDLPIVKKHMGKKKRRSFFCLSCQKLYI